MHFGEIDSLIPRLCSQSFLAKHCPFALQWLTAQVWFPSITQVVGSKASRGQQLPTFTSDGLDRILFQERPNSEISLVISVVPYLMPKVCPWKALYKSLFYNSNLPKCYNAWNISKKRLFNKIHHSSGTGISGLIKLPIGILFLLIGFAYKEFIWKW